MIEVNKIDLGLIEYAKAWDIQKSYFEQVTQRKEGSQLNYLLLCEHPHVYTLGKSGDIHNLLVNDEFLKKIGATFFKIDRGGDITYHGFGQLVGYPILNISDFGIGLREYIYKIEQAVICTIKHWGICGERIDGASGVWIKTPQGNKKICAVGVKASRWVTMHGFALNVNTNLSYFGYINPCGFDRNSVTSIKELTGGADIDFETVKETFSKEFALQFGCWIK